MKFSIGQKIEVHLEGYFANYEIFGYETFNGKGIYRLWDKKDRCSIDVNEEELTRLICNEV